MSIPVTRPDTADVSVTGLKDQLKVTVPFSGSDADVGDIVVNFRVVTNLPQHGVLKDGNGNVLAVGSLVPATGNGANVFFFPDAGWTGLTTFQYASRDSSLPNALQDATPATVTITIDDPPNTIDTSATGLE